MKAQQYYVVMLAGNSVDSVVRQEVRVLACSKEDAFAKALVGTAGMKFVATYGLLGKECRVWTHREHWNTRSRAVPCSWPTPYSNLRERGELWKTNRRNHQR